MDGEQTDSCRGVEVGAWVEEGRRLSKNKKREQTHGHVQQCGGS